MLVRRRMSVGGQGPQGQQIIRLEQFRDSQAAVDVLSRAREQAEALLVEAHAMRQQVLDDALAQFWEQAGGFLQGLEAERQALHDAVVEACGQLLNRALERVFEESPPGERARVLLTHLAASQTVAAVATVSCHPQRWAQVQAWLTASRYASVWQVREDSSLAVDALRLSCDNGEFELDWAGLQRCLSVPGSPAEVAR